MTDPTPAAVPPVTVIAIDGPAGSGKSTVAKGVARRTGLGYLDTGAMYRAVALAAMNRGVELDDTDAIAALARDITLEMGTEFIRLDGEDATAAIRTPEVTSNVSTVAANQAVRDEMRARQRAWADANGGCVMEGRDIGKVVFPNAAVKVYLVASIAERARRRAIQAGLDPAEVEADMRRRDTADVVQMERADDARELDTTDLSIDEVVEVIAGWVEEWQADASSADAPTESSTLECGS